MGRFPEECERLFFGGFFRIKLVCLRLLATNQIMEQFVRCCAYLDAMMTGDGGDELNQKEELILDNLIKHVLAKQTSIKFDDFMIECFTAYRMHKQEIILSFYQLDY